MFPKARPPGGKTDSHVPGDDNLTDNSWSSEDEDVNALVLPALNQDKEAERVP